MNAKGILKAACATLAMFGIASTPAHAAISLAASLPATAMAVLADQDQCMKALLPRLDARPPATIQPVLSKSEAILGGHLSKLEMIARQQAGEVVAAAQPVSLGQTGEIAPAAGGLRCFGFVLPSSPMAGFQPGLKPLSDPDDFLDSKRIAVRKTAFDSQWNRVRRAGLSRSQAERLTSATPGKPTEAMLRAVNSWSNANVRYEEDRDLYHRADYWADAGETLKRRAGDCEDIAIVKMQMLAALGVSRSDMFLTIARDRVRNADHALLVVKLDGKYRLLDNATDTLLDASYSYDYMPIMSFSTGHKWLHGFERTAAIGQPSEQESAAS